MSSQNNPESRRKALTEEIVNRIASDDSFRQEIVDDPAAALTRAGFAERLWELSDDVTGYGHPASAVNSLATALTLTLSGPGHAQPTVLPPGSTRLPPPDPKKGKDITSTADKAHNF
jgi:hypothetical protein